MKLPQLPLGAVYTRAIGTVGTSMYTYTTDQMHAHAAAAVAAERERCAAMCDVAAAHSGLAHTGQTLNGVAQRIRKQ